MRKKDLWIAIGAVFAAVVLSVTQFWGLTLETGEQIIVSRQYADELKHRLGVK